MSPATMTRQKRRNGFHGCHGCNGSITVATEIATRTLTFLLVNCSNEGLRLPRARFSRGQKACQPFAGGFRFVLGQLMPRRLPMKRHHRTRLTEQLRESLDLCDR